MNDQHTDASPNRSTTRAFAEAIHQLERTGSTEELVDLYAPECELGNVLTEESFRGHDGVRSFWSDYASTLGTAESSFSLMSADEQGAVLEWRTELRGDAGTRTYRGATVLQLEGGRIVRSMAYFDPARLGRVLDDVAGSPRGGDDEPRSGETGRGNGPAARTDAPPGSTRHGGAQDANTTTAEDGTEVQPGWGGPAVPGEEAAVDG